MVKSYLDLLQTSSKTSSLKKKIVFHLLSFLCNQRFPVKSLKRHLLPLLQHFQNPVYADFVNLFEFSFCTQDFSYVTVKSILSVCTLEASSFRITLVYAE